MIRIFRDGQTLKKKLLSYNIFMILMIVLLLSLSVSLFYQGHYRRLEFERIEEIQTQVQKSFDQKLLEVERSMNLLLSQTETLAALAPENPNSGGAALRPQRETALRQLLKKYSLAYPEYLNILLADVGGEAYISNDSYRLRKQSFASENWFTDALAQPQRFNYYFHTNTRNLGSWRQYGVNSYISFSKALTAPESQRPLGVLLLDINLETFKEMYNDISSDASGFMCFMNDYGKVLLGPENNIVYRIRPEWFVGAREGSLSFSLDAQLYNLFFRRSEHNNVILVSVYNQADFQRLSQRFTVSAMVIASLALLLASFWTFVFISDITRPLSRLSQLMRRAEGGELELVFDESCSGEIAVLGRSFNHMLREIRVLIEQNRLVERHKREAEMRILQEQIKPHFLYNTLDTISWMAKKHQASEIVKIVQALSDFCRLGLSGGKELIPLRDELGEVKSYLHIQAVRYAELFSFELDCPEELLDCRVVRLILQPLVENAIYHGIKESDLEHAHIWISVRREGDFLCLCVEDDGVGLSETEILGINCFLDGEQKAYERELFGMQNVHERLRMALGEGNGLSLEKRPGGGLRVRLRHALLLPENQAQTHLTFEKQGTDPEGGKEDVEDHHCG